MVSSDSGQAVEQGPKEDVKSPSWEISTPWLHMPHVKAGSALSRGLEQVTYKGHIQLTLFCGCSIHVEQKSNADNLPPCPTYRNPKPVEMESASVPQLSHHLTASAVPAARLPHPPALGQGKRVSRIQPQCTEVPASPHPLQGQLPKATGV